MCTKQQQRAHIIERKMAVGQKLIAKNKFISGAQYADFGLQIQNDRKKYYCLGFSGATTKNLLNINSFHFCKVFVFLKIFVFVR